MKYAALVVLLWLPAIPAAADSLRCGSQLVSTGDRAFEILRKCGEPVYRDRVGYTLGPGRRAEMPIEEWLYGPANGMSYILRLEGNRLVRIDALRLP
ncbi:MAG: DUF2845 domain-containing protein [Thiopseudomonas sp.]|nr:DUF2845 domain-containing protein [Gammaproteobacteria bacterium]